MCIRDSWNTIKTELEIKGIFSITPDLFELTKGRELGYATVYQAFERLCSSLQGRLNLCGLSLGAVSYTHLSSSKIRTISSSAFIVVPCIWLLPLTSITFIEYILLHSIHFVLFVLYNKKAKRKTSGRSPAAFLLKYQYQSCFSRLSRAAIRFISSADSSKSKRAMFSRICSGLPEPGITTTPFCRFHRRMTCACLLYTSRCV